jgi:hypothetical protein
MQKKGLAEWLKWWSMCLINTNPSKTKTNKKLYKTFIIKTGTCIGI